MRLVALSLFAVLCFSQNAHAESAPTKAAPTEELPDPNDDEPKPTDPSPAGTPKTTFPTPDAPKLPIAGKSIKIGLPEKNQGSSLLWKPRWSKFSTGEWIITGVSAAVALASLALPVKTDAWTSHGFLFDEPARKAVRIRGEGWRLNVRDTSDVLLSISTTYPFLVDAMLVAWWHRGSATVAKQMALINAETFAITAAIQGTVSGLVNRERPYGRECSDTTTFGATDDCIRYNRYRSFFSGHTAMAFAGAMLTCAHHANLPLYGTRGADRAACVTHVAVAFTIGTMRMLADMHYASDVMTGAIIGTSVGLAVPYLFHYHGASSTEETTATRSVWAGVRVIPMPTGLAVIGVFG
jgi:membrane-associated phospholipid phosphatase